LKTIPIIVFASLLESYAIADAHDGVINGKEMAGHVKTCRVWDQIICFRKEAAMGVFIHSTEGYSKASPFCYGDPTVYY
jgi:hypothetical protein